MKKWRKKNMKKKMNKKIIICVKPKKKKIKVDSLMSYLGQKKIDSLTLYLGQSVWVKTNFFLFIFFFIVI